MGYNPQHFIRKYFRVRHLQTPVFVYDHSLLLTQISTLKALCGEITDHYSIAYSYKTNPLLAKYVYQAGCAMQVTSPSHFGMIQKFVPKKKLKECFFNACSLTEDVTRTLAASSIHIVIDSLAQIELINKVGKAMSKPTPFLVRVDTGVKVKNTPFATSGATLGLPLDQTRYFLTRLKQYQWITFEGIHNHAASQNTDISSWRENMRVLERFVMSLPSHVQIRILNLGGGYPIPYVHTTPLTIQKIFSLAFRPSLQRILKQHPHIQLVIEPGRSLVGPVGFLVASVTNLQFSKGMNAAVVNASVFATFADRFLSKLTLQTPVYASRRGRKKYFIRGSSPASVDHFGTYTDLPDLRIGDTLIFTMMGAYASSTGSDFSGVSRPSEYLVKDNKLILLRR